MTSASSSALRAVGANAQRRCQPLLEAVVSQRFSIVDLPNEYTWALTFENSRLCRPFLRRGVGATAAVQEECDVGTTNKGQEDALAAAKTEAEETAVLVQNEEEDSANKKFLKSTLLLILYSKYTRALTFQIYLPEAGCLAQGGGLACLDARPSARGPGNYGDGRLPQTLVCIANWHPQSSAPHLVLFSRTF